MGLAQRCRIRAGEKPTRAGHGAQRKTGRGSGGHDPDLALNPSLNIFGSFSGYKLHYSVSTSQICIS